ncbi:MAG: endolytic transglycosylase MltG [Eubacteriales bacterium]|nr:endolytic transglycosylase MltG [Eubacteriales bacterium]
MIARRVKRTLLIVATTFILLVIAAIGFYFGMTYVISQNSRFDQLDIEFAKPEAENKYKIDEDSPGSIEIYIPRAADTQVIADVLKKANVIENSMVFTVLSKFNGFDGAYLAGTHYVTNDMSYDEIMYILTQKPNAVRVTFPEGLSYIEVKQRLTEAGVNYDEQVLDSMMINPQLFVDYPFVAEIKDKPGRKWMLQGYLYPDTYEFDMNTDEEAIIRTFLNNFQAKMSDKYEARAAEIGMTFDEAVALASIVQIECALNEEMQTVAGVFKNRLDQDIPLGTDATINYLRKEAGLDTKLWLSSEEVNFFDSPYNLYNNLGLPPGPICSPGDLAIKAALWPIKHNYLYFVATGDGHNVFATTLDQHNVNVDKYFAIYQKQQAENG